MNTIEELQTELKDVRELTTYWTARRDEAKRMVDSLLREERVIQDRMEN